jgi:acyl-coenzyme A synthetase/AMP-(fatty) acid ligase
MSLPLIDRIASVDPSTPALIWQGRAFSYGRLFEAAAAIGRSLADAEVPAGAVVSLETDYSPQGVGALLALIAHGAIVVPLAPATAEAGALGARAEVELLLTAAGAEIVVTQVGTRACHQLYRMLRRTGHPGLVLFSSGSDGRPKGAVHDLARLAARYERPGRPARICAFLSFDHIGGLNTLLYTLANGGCIVVPEGRLPDEICRAIESQRVEVLPTTPTFLGLLLLSGAWERYDLSALALVTYGTELMPTTTLGRLRKALPHVRVLQTYGLSETGILATRSPDAGSIWFTITAPDVETRIVGGVLHVRSPTTMLGYLDGSTERMLRDGWFDTGDLVECRGDLIKVLGRTGDVINVGGQKVHPAEVENVVLEIEGVIEARVSGETNALTGQHVRLEVVLETKETVGEFARRLRHHCFDRLQAFKVPRRIVVTDRPLHGRRYKKIRHSAHARSVA